MKYWVYINGSVPGSFLPTELVNLPGFAITTLICPAEGEILEKNWRRAGEFEEVVKALRARESARPPQTHPESDPLTSGDVSRLIDTASGRLFNHVASLMKELENRREERALSASLERKLVDMKDQLREAQEKSTLLESRMPRIMELEETVRKTETAFRDQEAALKAREEGLSGLRAQMEKVRAELENTKRRLGESTNDLAIRNRLVDKLSRDLTEKELSLAKALGVIRRLEEDLNRLCPVVGEVPLGSVPETTPTVALTPPPPSPEKEELSAPAQEQNGPEPVLDDSTEEPAPDILSASPEPLPADAALPVPPPGKTPEAHSALMNKLRKLVSPYEH